MRRRNSDTQYVLCIKNARYRASLVVRRVYRVIPDPEARKHGLLRVVDESGEDYLFPAKLFVAIELPKEAGKIFSVA